MSDAEPGPGEPIRLSKLMAQRGLCSRREADELISQGLVYVDGVQTNTLGVKVLPGQEITLAPAAVRTQQERVTILLNKPVGYVSGQPEKNYRPAVVLLTPANEFRDDQTGAAGARPPAPPRKWPGLAPAGRLDIDSRGLLVFTQDGRVAKLLTGENSTLDKEYLVRIRGDAGEPVLRLLRYGLALDGKPLKPAVVERSGTDYLLFSLREGRHRQIRRMCDAVGLEVLSLLRIRIGRVNLGDLPEGRWRFLRPDESF